MKYLVRALKYLLYFLIVFCFCILLVMLFSRRDGVTLATMFKEGSFLPICLIFLFFSAIYPLLGYRKGRLRLDGDWKDYRDTVVETMESGGYRLEEEDGGKLMFRHSKPMFRLSRMYEDAITFLPQENDPTLVLVDGPSRDTLKIIGSIYYNYRMQHPQDGE